MSCTRRPSRQAMAVLLVLALLSVLLLHLATEARAQGAIVVVEGGSEKTENENFVKFFNAILTACVAW
jgi:hypothetical protein